MYVLRLPSRSHTVQGGITTVAVRCMKANNVFTCEGVFFRWACRNLKTSQIFCYIFWLVLHILFLGVLMSLCWRSFCWDVLGVHFISSSEWGSWRQSKRETKTITTHTNCQEMHLSAPSSGDWRRHLRQGPHEGDLSVQLRLPATAQLTVAPLLPVAPPLWRVESFGIRMQSGANSPLSAQWRVTLQSPCCSHQHPHCLQSRYVEKTQRYCRDASSEIAYTYSAWKHCHHTTTANPVHCTSIALVHESLCCVPKRVQLLQTRRLVYTHPHSCS